MKSREELYKRINDLEKENALLRDFISHLNIPIKFNGGDSVGDMTVSYDFNHPMLEEPKNTYAPPMWNVNSGGYYVSEKEKRPNSMVFYKRLKDGTISSELRHYKNREEHQKLIDEQIEELNARPVILQNCIDEVCKNLKEEQLKAFFVDGNSVYYHFKEWVNFLNAEIEDRRRG